MRNAPAGFRPRERARGLAHGEPFLLPDESPIAQAAEVARREVGFDQSRGRSVRVPAG
jgi:hypothetical protein